jgi:hypothetical protein
VRTSVHPAASASVILWLAGRCDVECTVGCARFVPRASCIPLLPRASCIPLLPSSPSVVCPPLFVFPIASLCALALCFGRPPVLSCPAACLVSASRHTQHMHRRTGGKHSSGGTQEGVCVERTDRHRGVSTSASRGSPSRRPLAQSRARAGSRVIEAEARGNLTTTTRMQRPFAWRSDALADPRLAEAARVSPSRLSCRLAGVSAQPVSLTLARNRRGDASPRTATLNVCWCIDAYPDPRQRLSAWQSAYSVGLPVTFARWCGGLKAYRHCITHRLLWFACTQPTNDVVLLRAAPRTGRHDAG